MASGPIDVGVIELAEEAVPYSVTLPGRAVAFEQTEIRPRVGGVVSEIVYQPGTRVTEGDVLFRLEATTYEAQVAAAEASVASAQVAVDQASANVDRYERLAGVGTTQMDLESARSSYASAEATLRSAEATLQSAQLDLDRTEVTAPISGYVDNPAVSVGSLVTANQTTALTTITRIDPIFVDVAESSARMTRNREMIDGGELTLGDQLEVALTLENGSVYSGTGALVTPGFEVSTTTGTVDMRFRFDNADMMIRPGQFVRANVTLGTRQAILVPQRATERAADGGLTAFVVEDGAARLTTLTYSGTYQNAWVVTDGIAPDALLIVDGLSNLTDGAEVNTIPVTINASGVVEDVQQADGE